RRRRFSTAWRSTRSEEPSRVAPPPAAREGRSKPVPPGRSAMPIATVNPATGETLKTYEAMGEEEIERRLQLAEATFRTYRTTSFEERSALLRRAADLLDEDN